VFLPLLQLTFWNRLEDGQRLFLNFSDILETTPFNFDFIAGNKKKSQGAKSGE
jgi:hypothetical protein